MGTHVHFPSQCWILSGLSLCMSYECCHCLCEFLWAAVLFGLEDAVSLELSTTIRFSYYLSTSLWCLGPTYKPDILPYLVDSEFPIFFFLLHKNLLQVSQEYEPQGCMCVLKKCICACFCVLRFVIDKVRYTVQKKKKARVWFPSTTQTKRLYSMNLVVVWSRIQINSPSNCVTLEHYFMYDLFSCKI